MKTLDQHNKERMNFFIKHNAQNDTHPNGIECPKCGHELCDSNPNVTLSSYPPQKNVHCPECGYTGYRIA